MTLNLSIRLTEADVDRSQLSDVEDHLQEAACSVAIHPFRDLRDDHPALVEWDRLTTEAIARIAPQVEDMVLDAIRALLPWEWSDDR